MGVSERKLREKEMRLNAILEAAEHVFLAEGRIEDATVDDIARQAELSKGTLYLYFKDKNDLLISVVYKALHKLTEVLQTKIHQNISGLKMLSELAMGYVEYAKRYPQHFKLLSQIQIYDTLLSGETPNARKCYMENLIMLSFITQAIERGIRDGSIRKDLHPRKTAVIIWAQLQGVLMIVLNKVRQVTEYAEYQAAEQMIDDHIEIMLQGLRTTVETALVNDVSTKEH